MFHVTASVETDFRFKEFGRLVELRVNKALAEGAAYALEAVRHYETRYGTDPRGPGPHFRKPNDSGPDHLRDSFHPAVVTRWRGVMGVSSSQIIIWTANPNAIWQELGTRGRRGSSLKQGGSPKKKGAVTVNVNDTPENAGVAPLYFMRRALRFAMPQVTALIRGAVASAASFDMGSPLFETTGPENYEASSFRSL